MVYLRLLYRSASIIAVITTTPATAVAPSYRDASMLSLMFELLEAVVVAMGVGVVAWMVGMTDEIDEGVSIGVIVGVWV